MCASNKPSQALLNAQKELERRRRMAGIVYRPPTPPAASEGRLNWPPREETPAAEKAEKAGEPLPKTAVRIAPTLAAYCLNKNNRWATFSLAGPYRLYKILQALDHQGRGWLANQWVTNTLCLKDHPAYVYGKRQLKIMLRRGEGLFWQRVKSRGEVRIRLVSRVKVARQLGCGRLRGKEITFPLSYLLGAGRGRQADVNAALFAAIHAGGLQGKEGPRPISRTRLQAISGCSPYRQRSYERRAGIQAQANIHILGPYSDYQLTRVRLQQQLPAYKHTDYLGLINRHRRGADYIAVRLPNSYKIPEIFAVIDSRRQQRDNRLLDGLCHMGSGGSDGEEFVRLFHGDPAAAFRSLNKNSNDKAFWPIYGKRRVRLWRSAGDLE